MPSLRVALATAPQRNFFCAVVKKLLQFAGMEHLQHLNKDRKLRSVIALQAPVQLEIRKQVWLRLCASIMSQQLSTKVAAVIYGRFLQLYGGKPTLHSVYNTPATALRSIGLSNAKAGYVQNVCRFFIEEKVTDSRLHKMGNEEVIAYLTQIKGVGRWTVEMILMFTLGREDVFALDDLGIQQSMAKLYGLNTTDRKQLRKQMEELSARWRPYRTYACRYLWGWKDNAPDK